MASDNETAIIVLSILLFFFVFMSIIMCCSWGDVRWIKQCFKKTFKNSRISSRMYKAVSSEGEDMTDAL